MLKRVVRLRVCAVLMWCLPVSADAQFETAAYFNETAIGFLKS